MSETTPVWPIGLYAPGGYACTCVKCGQQHIADKRARHCADCTLQDLRTRLAEVEKERDEALGWRTVAESNQAMAQSWQARAERAEAALATARRDALEQAAQVADLSWQRWKGDSHGLPVVECDVTACDNIAAAIRALIDKDATP